MNKFGISRLVTASAVVGITAVGLSNAAYAACADINDIPRPATATCHRVNNDFNPNPILPCVGTPGPDIIVGSPGPDVIESLAGDDIVVGQGGNDVICTAAGNDLVDTGGGLDVARTGGGNDAVSSSGGGSRHFGGTGTDTSATVFAISSNGGGGNDALFGDIFQDVLNGGAGDDLLNGSGGGDTLNGAGGKDVCIAGGPGASFFGCEFPL